MPQVHAQSCQYVYNEDGQRQERLIEVDGETHFIFPKNKGKKLLADVKKLDSYKAELRLKDQKISLLKDRIDLFQERATLWKGHYETERQLVKTMVKHTDQTQSFWQEGWVQFGIGFIVASGLYAGWQASYQKF